MSSGQGTSLETRPSLLQRLGTGDDPAGWQEFYSIYGGLIRSFATKAGLTEDEAEEVLQETAIGVARGLPDFVYNPKACRFKTWLLNLTRWRIRDQLRRRKALRRGQEPALRCGRSELSASVGQEETATVERVPDPNLPDFGAEWDEAWAMNLLARALERVREQIDERAFQIFDLCVLKGWPPRDVARTLGIAAASVYLSKHRVSIRIKKEIRRLERLGERRAGVQPAPQ